MASDAEMTAEQPAPGVPDYLASPNAVFGDEGVEWRYGKPPDYSKTRKVWEEGKTMNHEAGSLPQLVENLVKNWEVEASFKPRLQDWRTIDHKNYSFAMNGGRPQSAEHMLKVGTYNAIIAPNEYYSPENSDFASSHKTFKRMMPTFAWEVIEVYSGPPKVAFKWRHWGTMKNDYVGFNDKGEKVTAKAHGGPIEVYGITVAEVDDKVRLQAIDTWMDPLSMFRQIAPHGVVNKEIMNRKVDRSEALDTSPDNDGIKIAQEHNQPNGEQNNDLAPTAVNGEPVASNSDKSADGYTPEMSGCPFATKMPSNGLHNQTNETSAPSASNPADLANDHGTAVQQPNPQTPTNTVKDNKHQKMADSTQGGAEVAASSPHKDVTEDVPRSIYSSAVTGDVEDIVKLGKSDDFVDESTATGTYDAVDRYLERPTEQVHPHRHDMEQAVKPEAGEAVVASPESEETRQTHAEMSSIDPEECPMIMNRE